MANEPTFNPNAYRDFGRRSSGATARCRICTSRDRRSRSSPRRRRSKRSVMPIDTLIDTNPGHHPDRHRASSTTTRTQLRRAVVHRRDRQVEQRRRDQDRLQGRHRAARADTSRGSASASRVSPDFPGESPGIVWSAGQVDRERAGVGVDGLPGRRDAAADGGGRQLGRQRRRVRRAARRPRGVPRRPALRRAAEGRCAGRSAPRPRRR